MKIGIDSFCYHRLLGEVWSDFGEQQPKEQMTNEAFIHKAIELGFEGVSLQSCFIPELTNTYLANIKKLLDDNNMERVYAWGHPDGLQGGRSEEKYDDMVRHIEYASAIGAKVMRVAGSDFTYRHEPHEPIIENLSRMFCDAAKIAQKNDIKMGMENHLEFSTDEILTIINNVNSPYFGITFDTGNFFRLLEDPVQAAHQFAKHIFASHIKDVKPLSNYEAPVNNPLYFRSTPIGKGLVDLTSVLQVFKDNDYHGLLSLEFDVMHPDYRYPEDQIAQECLMELRKIADNLK